MIAGLEKRGGSNGALLIEELDRGSIGTMPHPAMIDAFRLVVDQHLGGDREAAWDWLRGTVPL